MNSIISHDYIVSEVLDVSQTVCHRNVTIICSNGTFKSNSFVLASVFPIFRDILDTPVQVDDPAHILRDLWRPLLGQFMVNSKKTMTPAQERTTSEQFR